MAEAKAADVNVKMDASVKETASQVLASTETDLTTLDEQLAAAIEKSRPKAVRLEVDENGAILIDKDLHPDLYNWVLNG